MSRKTSPLVLRTALILALLGTGLGSLGALEFGFQGNAGNFNFPWDQQVPTVGTFPDSNYIWGGSAYVGLPLSEESSLRLTYERDEILRNVVLATVQFERGITKISVGPYFGLFNSDATPFNMGLSTSIRFQWPGIAYASVRSDGAIAIGSLADALGAEPQTRAEIAAGFYTKNAIISGVISATSYSETDAAGLTVTDALSSYLLTIDLFKKNIPYTVMAEMGYEVRSKYYEASATTDALGGVVLGAEATVSVMPGFSLLASFKSEVFVFGLDALSGRSPDQTDVFLSASLGCAFDTEVFQRHLKAKAAREKKPAPAEKPAPVAVEAAKPADDGEEVPLPPPIQAPAEAEAQAPASKLSFDAGAGLYYNFVPLSDSLFALLEALYNLRGGVWVGANFDMGHHFTLGGEVGLQYISSSLDGGTTVASVFDLPLRGTAGYTLGPLGLKAFLGIMPSGALSDTFTMSLGLEAGMRVSLAGFYAEGSYVLGLGSATSYPRAGVGFMLTLESLLGKKL